MINSMTYKGYTASMVFDAEDKIIVGRVLDIDDIISFHGESVTELESNFRAAIEDYLAASKELGSAAKKAGQWQNYAAHCARGPCCSPQGCGEKRYQSKQMGRGSTGSGNSKTMRSGCGAKRSLSPLA